MGFPLKGRRTPRSQDRENIHARKSNNTGKLHREKYEELEKGRTEATSMGVAQSVDEKTTYDDLIPLVIADDNIDEALKVVVGNRGAPGMDGMSVHELEQWMDTNRQKFIESEWLSVRERCTNCRVPNVMHGGGNGQPTA